MSEPIVAAGSNILSVLLQSGVIGVVAMFFLLSIALVYVNFKIHSDNVKNQREQQSELLKQQKEQNIALFAALDASNEIIKENTKAYMSNTQTIDNFKEFLTNLILKKHL